MSRTYEGVIEIPLEEFWAFVSKYGPSDSDEIRYGVPRANRQNATIEIDYAGDSDGCPECWLVKPIAITQWEKEEA